MAIIPVSYTHLDVYKRQTLGCEGELYDFLKSVEKELTTAFIVSAVEIVNTPSGDFAGDVEGLKVTISKADGEKCERCWTFSNTVGQDIEPVSYTHLDVYKRQDICRPIR